MFLLSYEISDVTIILSIISIVIYWYLTNNFDYWKKRNVVCDKAYPLIGTIGEALLMRDNNAIILQKLYQRFANEPLIGGFLSKTPMLIVKDPDIIKNIMIKDFNYFHDRGATPVTEREPLTQHLFLSNGETWRTLRQKLSPTFTSGKMRNMFPLLAECGKEFQHYLLENVNSGKNPEMKELSAKFTIDVIGSCAFGIKINSLKDENSQFTKMGRQIFEPSVSRTLKLTFQQILPWLFDLFQCRITSIEMQDFFINIVKSVMQSRDYRPSLRHDFIDLLIELKTQGYVHNDKNQKDTSHDETKINQNAINDFKMTDGLLTAQAFIFFVAGFETSSATMSFALYELAKNQEVQSKLIGEIDKILQKYDRKITYESLKEMPYLKMVINETLRKHPPIGILLRECTIPYTIPNLDINLDKGVLVNIPVYALHHDAKYFPEPEKFIPERFTAEAVAERNPYVYMPFGDGPRVCIGERFAFMQSMVGLISILEQFTVEVSDKTVQEIKFAAASFIMECKDGIFLNLKPKK